MNFIGLLLTAAPAFTLDAWVTTKASNARNLRFTDSAGAHVVTFQLSGVRTEPQGDDAVRSQDLLVTHLIGKKELWRAKDFVEKCEFDLSFEVIDGSIEVTDLDDDGEAEISFAYKLGCRSDVSALTVKVLLYEGATKYALRGESREQVGENEFVGGEFKADPAFDKAPKFLEFAKAKWKVLVLEPR